MPSQHTQEQGAEKDQPPLEPGRRAPHLGVEHHAIPRIACEHPRARPGRRILSGGVAREGANPRHEQGPPRLPAIPRGGLQDDGFAATGALAGARHGSHLDFDALLAVGADEAGDGHGRRDEGGRMKDESESALLTKSAEGQDARTRASGAMPGCE